MPTANQLAHPTLVRRIATKIDAKLGGWMRRQRFGHDRKSPVEARAAWASMLRELDQQPAPAWRRQPAAPAAQTINPIPRTAAAPQPAPRHAPPRRPGARPQQGGENRRGDYLAVLFKHLGQQVASSTNPPPGAVENLQIMEQWARLGTGVETRPASRPAI